MDSKDNKNISKNKVLEKQERRSFLKKAAYSAPTLLALGYLSRPTSAYAESRPVGVPCSDDPDNNPNNYPPCF